MSSQTYDASNIFAKILRGELPSTKVLEDDHVLVIMDVMPQGEGHTLVIPKARSRNILDIGEEDLKRTILVVQRVARAVKKAFDAPGVFVMQFNEPAAGQTVFHTHFHVIPRFDGVALRPHTGGMENPDLLREHA
jgi:histidine triad (HIT) family protein